MVIGSRRSAVRAHLLSCPWPLELVDAAQRPVLRWRRSAAPAFWTLPERRDLRRRTTGSGARWLEGPQFPTGCTDNSAFPTLLAISMPSVRTLLSVPSGPRQR